MRSRRLRWVLGIAVAVLAVLLANAWLMGRETRPAEADGGRIVQLPGGDLHVVEDGPRGAPPVVLLHGATGSVRWWQAQARALRRDHRVLRFDLLGNGGSEAPREGYGIEEQADLLAAALRRLRVRGAAVGGYSFGGTVATALATRHADLVASLVLVDTAPSPDWFQYGLTNKLSVAPVVGPALRRVATDGMLRRGAEQAFAPGYRVPDWVVDDIRRTTFSSFREPRLAQLDYLEERPLPERLAELDLPVLVLFGTADRLVDPDAVREWRELPGARVELIRGAGHTPIVERPDEATRLIRAFLDAADSGPRGAQNGSVAERNK